MDHLADLWDELDSWWDTYSETGTETAVQLAEHLRQSNRDWTTAAAPFDTDPLAVDLTRDRIRRGPLQPSTEVGWSRWLAQVLRPSAALSTELFDRPEGQPPQEVILEDTLPKSDGSSRRPDILLLYDDCGVSIEVKLDDENYQKTAETAALVEAYYDDLEWSHYLLLPKRKMSRLDAIVEPLLTELPDGRTEIAWDDPGPVTVLHWRDVTTAIRTLLYHADIVDDHWGANAYLFCAVAEQQLLKFQSQPVIEQLAAPATVVNTARPIRIAHTLGEQLTYLRERVFP
ncbi:MULTISPECIES: hypothetical protein [Haloferax]|uniref:hypothetical protein n=1 Tax=Haloferax TaxID=2251 RepID=UPI001CDA1B3B|nr:MULTISPECIES: hypothetical protein [Haloferax]